MALAHTCASTMRGTARTWPDWDIPSEPPDNILLTTRCYYNIIIGCRDIFNRFVYAIVCFNTITINKANIFQSTVFLLPAFTRHFTKFTKYWTLLHASWLSLNVFAEWQKIRYEKV